MNTELTLWHIIGIIGLIFFLILVVVSIISIVVSMMTELRTRKGDVHIKSEKMIKSVNKGLKKLTIAKLKLLEETTDFSFKIGSDEPLSKIVDVTLKVCVPSRNIEREPLNIPMSKEAYEFLFPIKQNGKRSLREGSITALLPGPNRTGKSTLMKELAQYMADTQDAIVFFVLVDAKTLNEIHLSDKPDEQSNKITNIMMEMFKDLHVIAKKYTEKTGKKAIFLPCIDEIDNKNNDPNLPVIISLPSVIDFYDTLFPNDRTATQNNELTSHLFLAANNPDQVSINDELANQGKTNFMNTFLFRIKNFLNFEYAITESDVQRAALCVITNKQVFEKEIDSKLSEISEEHKAKLQKVMNEFKKVKVEAMERTKKALEKAYPGYVKDLMNRFDKLCNLTTRREEVHKFLYYDDELTEFNYQHFDIGGKISKKKTGRNSYFDETVDGILKCINIPSLSLDQILGAINDPSYILQDVDMPTDERSNNGITSNS